MAIALGNTVHLWDASNGSAFVLLNTDQENGPITSISWAPNGQHIAIGMKSAIVEIWDTTVNQKVRALTLNHIALFPFLLVGWVWRVPILVIKLHV